ncbi:site-specific recombinase [Escherichia coli O26:H11 str. CVM9942]|nr:site-specific recombinase [Escherichia coli O26:H11 str. CVM9942]
MNNVIPLQNSPERVSLLPIAPGVDFATALSLRRMATSTGATPAYLLAPEVSALLFYMPDQRHHMLFATLWNTGMRIGEARMLTPESFDLDGVRPFVRILSEKVRARRGRPPKMKSVWFRVSAPSATSCENCPVWQQSRPSI